ncbi:hypothetical protein Bca52824_007150 [Brassica carinata]|uniref:Uncharacterized protein n=1 Tax=Brassica carinata TaxID=52824 RepID=A0A8X7W7G1_BRACI|nr:hypothetical protein Bca52824_007150 [Brassica carinata]
MTRRGFSHGKETRLAVSLSRVSTLPPLPIFRLPPSSVYKKFESWLTIWSSSPIFRLTALPSPFKFACSDFRRPETSGVGGELMGVDMLLFDSQATMIRPQSMSTGWRPTGLRGRSQTGSAMLSSLPENKLHKKSQTHASTLPTTLSSSNAFPDAQKQLYDISARKEEKFAATASLKADIEKKKIEQWKLEKWNRNHIRARKSFPQKQAAREKRERLIAPMFHLLRGKTVMAPQKSSQQPHMETELDLEPEPKK